MKSLRLYFLCLAVAFPVTAMSALTAAEPANTPMSRITDATVDEVTFQWENAMSLAAADPCAIYLAPRYNSEGHEGHYDDDGVDLRKEFGLIL